MEREGESFGGERKGGRDGVETRRGGIRLRREGEISGGKRKGGRDWAER
jgi:hypothetical protein